MSALALLPIPAGTPCAAPGSVEVVRGRYPYKPVCSCGWTTWGYVADHAAQGMLDAHHAGRLRPGD